MPYQVDYRNQNILFVKKFYSQYVVIRLIIQCEPMLFSSFINIGEFPISIWNTLNIWKLLVEIFIYITSLYIYIYSSNRHFYLYNTENKTDINEIIFKFYYTYYLLSQRRKYQIIFYSQLDGLYFKQKCMAHTLNTSHFNFLILLIVL